MTTQNQNQSTDTDEILSEEDIVKNQLAIIPEAERKEILGVVKTQDVVLIDTHKKKLKNFKTRFNAKKFEIKEDMVFDKEAYEKALAAWREIKNYRTKIVKPDFDKLKAPYIAITKFYNETCNPLIENFKDIENPIGAFVDKMEALEKEEKDRERINLEKRSNERVKLLIDAGAPFDSQYYSVGSEEFGVETISIGMETINSVPDDIFEKLLKEIKEKSATISQKQKAKDDAIRLEQEKKDEDLRKLKENNLKLRAKELKFMGFSLNEPGDTYSCNGIQITVKQVAELGLDEWEGLIHDTENKLQAITERIAKRERTEKRKSELVAIGLQQTMTGFVSEYKENTIHVSNGIIENEDDAIVWDEAIKDAKDNIAKQKQQKIDDDAIEAKEKALLSAREQALSPYWQFLTGDEKKSLGKMDDDAFIELSEKVQKLHSDKIEKDHTDKLAKDKKEKDGALAKQGDEAIYNDFVTRLRDVSVPTVATPEYNSKVAEIIRFLKTL